MATGADERRACVWEEGWGSVCWRGGAPGTCWWAEVAKHSLTTPSGGGRQLAGREGQALAAVAQSIRAARSPTCIESDARWSLDAGVLAEPGVLALQRRPGSWAGGAAEQAGALNPGAVFSPPAGCWGRTAALHGRRPTLPQPPSPQRPPRPPGRLAASDQLALGTANSKT